MGIAKVKGCRESANMIKGIEAHLKYVTRIKHDDNNFRIVLVTLHTRDFQYAQLTSESRSS